MHRVIMRTLLAFALVTTGCAANLPTGSDSYDSVKDRMQDEPTRLFVGGDSTGTVTARRYSQGGWIEGDHTLSIDGGELRAKVDSSGKLTLESFEVAVAPIEIPEEVFKQPAHLADVKVTLVEATTGAATWSDDNDATATLPLKLDLQWAIAINGGKTPLGEQHLPPVDVQFTLSGDGEYVSATIGLAATGELWNWAGLLQMTKLELRLGAETVE
jgi:hypothetical protein